MTTYAIITDGIVTNIILADAEFAASVGAIPAQGAGIGWTYAGGVFTAPAAVPAPVPESVSPRQIRQALTRAGLRASLEAAVASADQDIKDWYEFATDFLRHSPVVLAMGEALGVTSGQLDDLWILAATL